MSKTWVLFFLYSFIFLNNFGSDQIKAQEFSENTKKSLETSNALQKVSIDKILVELLFQIGKESFTSLDQEEFIKLSEVVEKFCSSSKFLKNQNESTLFYLNKLIINEVIALEMEANKEKLSIAIQAVKNHSAFSSNPEKVIPLVKSYCKVSQLLEAKQNFFKSDVEFINWIAVLKRKYTVRYKSAEFQKNIKAEFR